MTEAAPVDLDPIAPVVVVAVEESLHALERAAREPNENLMPPILDAVRAMATEGEIADTLAEVYGRYREDPVI